MDEYDISMEGLIQELRRGTLVLAVLSRLSQPQYGYSLVSMLDEKGVSIDPGTLYPLLRRLEGQGILESQWDTSEARPRKYYLLSSAGKEAYSQLCKEWEKIAISLNGLIKGEN